MGAQAEFELGDLVVALADAAQVLFDAAAVLVGDEIEQALADRQAPVEAGGVAPGAVEEGHAAVAVSLEEDFIDRLDDIPIHGPALAQHLLGRQPAGHVAQYIEHRGTAVEAHPHRGGFGVDRFAVEAPVAQRQGREGGLLRVGFELFEPRGFHGPVVAVDQREQFDAVQRVLIVGAEKPSAGGVGEVNPAVDAYQRGFRREFEKLAVALLAAAPIVERVADGRDEIGRAHV